MNDCYIIDAVRTPIGKYGGKLSSVRPDDLLAHVITALLNRNPVDPKEIEDVMINGRSIAGSRIDELPRFATQLGLSYMGH